MQQGEEATDEEIHELNINAIDDVFDNAHKLNTNEENDECILDEGIMINEIDLADNDVQRPCTISEQCSYDPNTRTPTHALFNNYLKTLK